MEITLEPSLITPLRIIQIIPPREFETDIYRIHSQYSSDLDRFFLEGGDNDNLDDIEQEILENLDEPSTIGYEVNTTRKLNKSEFTRQNQTIINKIPWFLTPSIKSSVRITRWGKGPHLLHAKLLPGSKLIKGIIDEWVIVPENTVFEIIKETPNIIYTVVHPQSPYEDPPTYIIPMSYPNVSQLSSHEIDYTDKYDPNWLNQLDQQHTQYIHQVLLTNPHLHHLFPGYTGGDYKGIRDVAIGMNLSQYSPFEIELYQKFNQLWNMVIKGTQPLDRWLTVCRGIDLNKDPGLTKYVEQLQEGFTTDIFYYSVLSSSVKCQVSCLYAGTTGYIFKLYLPPGSKGLYVGGRLRDIGGGHFASQEYLFQKGIKFQVIAVDHRSVPYVDTQLCAGANNITGGSRDMTVFHMIGIL